MLFHKRNTKARTVLPLAFFGSLIALLIITDALGPIQAVLIASPSCTTDEDCPVPTTYCSISGKCTALTDPVCDCSQENVLRCYEQDTEKARFLFCPNGCSESSGQAICN